MCGNTDAPAGKHPDEPNVVGTAIEVDRDEHADHQHENTEVNNEGPHGWILAQAAAAAALDELGGTVRRNPLAAAGIALGAGFIYGVLTRR